MVNDFELVHGVCKLEQPELLELIENTEYVLSQYRSNNKYQRDYIGDSIINSIGDIFCCFIGFTIGYHYY